MIFIFFVFFRRLSRRAIKVGGGQCTATTRIPYSVKRSPLTNQSSTLEYLLSPYDPNPSNPNPSDSNPSDSHPSNPNPSDPNPSDHNPSDHNLGDEAVQMPRRRPPVAN